MPGARCPSRGPRRGSQQLGVVGVVGVLDRLLEEVSLGAEVVDDARRARAGALGDVADADARQALLRQQLHRRGQDLRSAHIVEPTPRLHEPLLIAPAPARRIGTASPNPGSDHIVAFSEMSTAVRISVATRSMSGAGATVMRAWPGRPNSVPGPDQDARGARHGRSRRGRRRPPSRTSTKFAADSSGSSPPARRRSTSSSRQAIVSSRRASTCSGCASAARAGGERGEVDVERLLDRVQEARRAPGRRRRSRAAARRAPNTLENVRSTMTPAALGDVGQARSALLPGGCSRRRPRRRSRCSPCGSASRNAAHSAGSRRAPVGLLGSQIHASLASGSCAAAAIRSRSSRELRGSRRAGPPRPRA